MDRVQKVKAERGWYVGFPFLTSRQSWFSECGLLNVLVKGPEDGAHYWGRRENGFWRGGFLWGLVNPRQGISSGVLCAGPVGDSEVEVCEE